MQKLFRLYDRYSQAVVAFILALYCLPLYFTLPLVRTLDGAWDRALNYCVSKDFVFGTDIIFAYGPLGYLSTRYGEFISPLQFVTYDVFVFTGFYYFFYRYLPPRKGWLYILFFGLLLMRAGNCSQVLFFLFTIYTTLFFLKDKISYFELIYCSLSGILLFFIKLNYGIISLALLLLVAAFLFVKDRKACIIYLTVSAIFFTVILFRVHIDVIHYIKYGLLLITNYEEALSLPVAAFQFPHIIAIALILLLLSVLIASAIKLRHAKTFGLHSVLSILLFCLSCFLFYKNGFTRADFWHWCDFFCIFPAFLVAAVVISGFAASVTGRLVAIIGIALSSYAIAYRDNSSELTWFGDDDIVFYESSISPIGYFSSMFTPPDASINPNFVFPPAKATLIGQQTMDILPFDNLQLIYNNQLNYLPRPSIQSAYCTTIDSLNGSWLASARRPQVLMLRNIDIDNRYSFWDESITKASIHLNYNYLDFMGRPEDTLAPMSYLILSSIPGSSRRPEFKPVKEITTAMNEMVRISFAETEAIYMQADIGYTTATSLSRFLSQAPALNITLYYDDGSSGTFRAIVPILRGPVLINKAVTNSMELKNFVSGNLRKNRNIVGFSFNPIATGFRPTVNVTFLKFTNY